MPATDVQDVLIIGQGVAAFSAALYAGRYQIKALVVGDVFGGETATGGLIENYPGHVEVSGFDLMLAMKEQAQKYDVPVMDGKVTSITRESDCFMGRTGDGAEYRATAVVLAVGRERRKLSLPHVDEWVGHGVSYCAVCDAPLYRERVAAVVGGGDAAVKGATLVSHYADKVYMIYRGDRLWRPEPVNVTNLEARDNVVTLFNTNVIELKGEGGLSGIVLDREVDGSREIEVDGLFLELGADPNVDLARQLGVNLNDVDEIAVDMAMRTNVDGVFAAGDVTNGSGDLKQAITAAAQGAIAATTAHEYVKKDPNACKRHAVGYTMP